MKQFRGTGVGVGVGVAEKKIPSLEMVDSGSDMRPAYNQITTDRRPTHEARAKTHIQKKRTERALYSKELNILRSG